MTTAGTAIYGEKIKMNKSILTIATLVAAGSIAQADTVYFQDFSTQQSGYSTSVTEFSDGSGDYFTQTDGSNIDSRANYTNNDGSFFAGMDLDGEGSSLPLSLTTDTFDISGSSNIQFAIDLAESDAFSNSNNDWDDSDYVSFEYQVDGGAWESIFSAVNDGSQFNSAAFINGVEITNSFSTFSADLSAISGMNMAIRLVWNLNSGDEDLAIDNIRITADNMAVVPLPPAAIAGLGMLACMGFYSRVRK